jgi:hypothetical protein
VVEEEALVPDSDTNTDMPALEEADLQDAPALDDPTDD